MFNVALNDRKCSSRDGQLDDVEEKAKPENNTGFP